MDSGRVEGIFIASGPKARPQEVEHSEAIAGFGLAGDRYAEHTGSWWKPEKSGQHLTLIEAETIERIAKRDGGENAPGAPRRNVVTRGIRVRDLIGQRFRIGD